MSRRKCSWNVTDATGQIYDFSFQVHDRITLKRPCGSGVWPCNFLAQEKKTKTKVTHLRRCSELLMQAVQHSDCKSMEMESSSAGCPQDNKDQSPYQPMRDV